MTIFCFPDIETTGTDEHEDVILEIAWAFTDESFTVLGTPRTFVVKPDEMDWAKIAHRLGANKYVRDMHTSSGLFADITVAESDIADIVLAFERDLRSSIVRPNFDDLVHLAGLSVHFDRTFLNANHFRLDDEHHIHHRHLDLSSIKMMLEAAGVPYQKAENSGAHRALNDVFEAIEQARIFKALFSQLPVV